MVQYTPDPHALLPPLLACLPLACASPRPPPALLPLLSPILRQRVLLLSQTESWLPLLCWDREKASNLAAVVNTIEPHPASGEIELGDVHIRYRRRDEETLEARIELPDLNLLPVYLWCTEEQEWLLAELHTTDDKPEEWFPSMDVPQTVNTTQDEDDYWNMYDRTPSRTPTKSPAPQVHDDEYFARYAEVQPALEPETPNEPSPIEAAAEVAIKQHISTDLKSLYRLARGAGIAREEFERIVRTELDVLGMMGLDE